MDRFYRLASRLFGCLAFVLAALAPLAVPQGALGDSGGNCVSNCYTSCYFQCGMNSNCMNACTARCPGQCCYQQCLGDSSCQSACCQSTCNGDPTCLTNCNAFVAITDCGPGNPDCRTYSTQTDCEPGFNNKCNSSNINCACRWRPMAGGGYACYCQNITGN